MASLFAQVSTTSFSSCTDRLGEIILELHTCWVNNEHMSLNNVTEPIQSARTCNQIFSAVIRLSIIRCYTVHGKVYYIY